MAHGADASDVDDAQVASYAHSRGAEYREALMSAVTPELWRGIVSRAMNEATRGDAQARDWIQRVLGVANAARVEAELRARADQVTLSQVLDALAVRRRGAVEEASSADASRPGGPVDSEAVPGPTTYWSVVFEVVSRSGWMRIVDVAAAQAAEGDPRAREWLSRVLGVDNALEFAAREAHSASFVTISTLVSALAKERDAALRP
ncbi:MAG TPA: hypothetical protein VMV69_13325 [Pirellulales bacterium]|nr:hypothetical protein [Pirellulales bacterium]